MTNSNPYAFFFNPCEVFSATGLVPDQWQREFLQSTAKRIIALTTRQCGKSTVAAALCLHQAITRPEQLIILLSPTERQSKHIFKKCLEFYRKLGSPLPATTLNKTSVEFKNGSVIVALPSNEEGIRGYSAPAIIVLDEAAQVSETLFFSVLPMLATSNGRLIAISTPFGKRGWFWEAWENRNTEDSAHWKVTADQCSRIQPDFLESAKRKMGVRWFNQEFLCEFTDVVDAAFSYSDVVGAIDSSVVPLAI